MWRISKKKYNIILWIVAAAVCLILDCAYSVRSIWVVGAVYHCNARIIFVGDPRNVTEVSHNHTPGNDHSTVLSIEIANQIVPLAPHFICYFKY